MLSPQIRKVVQIKGIRRPIVNSGKIKSINHISVILIIMPNKPKVNMRNGIVINFKIGLIKKLTAPKTKPAKPNTNRGPSNFTPGINWLASQSPKTPEIICKIRFFSTFLL